MLSLCFSVYRRHKLCHLEWSYQTGLIWFRSLRCKNRVMFHHYVNTEFGTWRSIENMSTMSWVTGGTMQPAGGRPGWSEVGETEEEVPGQDLLSENREVGEKGWEVLNILPSIPCPCPRGPSSPFLKTKGFNETSKFNRQLCPSRTIGRCFPQPKTQVTTLTRRSPRGVRLVHAISPIRCSGGREVSAEQ